MQQTQMQGRKGEKKKLLGTLTTLQHQNSLKFQIANQKMSMDGIVRLHDIDTMFTNH